MCENMTRNNNTIFKTISQNLMVTIRKCIKCRVTVNLKCCSAALWARRGSLRWSTHLDIHFWWTSTAASRPATTSASSWSIYRVVTSWSTYTTTSSLRPRPGSYFVLLLKGSLLLWTAYLCNKRSVRVFVFQQLYAVGSTDPNNHQRGSFMFQRDSRGSFSLSSFS